MAAPRSRIDFVPPPEPHEPAPGDVLEVVEVGGEEEHGDDEDEHEARGEEPEAEEVYEEGCWERLSSRLSFTAKRAGGAGVGRGLTDAESEEEEQRDGMGAQAPVQVALLRLLGSVFHCGKMGERVSVGKDVFHKTSVGFGELS